VVLPRTGHVAQMEHPGAVAGEVAQMLGRGNAGGARAGGQAREFPVTSAG
jgi:hypothetical protein